LGKHGGVDSAGRAGNPPRLTMLSAFALALQQLADPAERRIRPGTLTMPRNAVLCLFALPLLAACGGAGAAVKSAPARPALAAPAPAPVRTPGRRPPPRAQVQVAPGLEGVIGTTAEDLLAQFGAARLDVWEGDARKLQFTGTACVLDVYLYPPAPGRKPEATFVEARRASDGQDVDRAACVSALRGTTR